MKFLLVAINAKYIHSNPGVYSLKTFAEQRTRALVRSKETKDSIQGGRNPQGGGLPPAHARMCGATPGNAGEETGGIAPGNAGEETRGTAPGNAYAAVQVEIAEYTINNQMERILEDIYRRRPDMVGFSCYIWNVEHVLNLVRDLHKVLPDTDIWLGGPEVSFDAPELLGREPEVLGVMKGEGEETFAGLLDCYGALGQTVREIAERRPDTAIVDRAAGVAVDEAAHREAGASAAGAAGRAAHATDHAAGQVGTFWKKLADVAGLTYRKADGSICDQASRPVMDMNQIPFLYPDLEGFEHRIVYYESSRGCPFSCSYCLSSIDKTVRFRDLELVKAELDFFLERKVPQVKFVDRTFNCKKSHALAVWQHILEHDNGVTNFHFEIAADLLDEEELELIGRMRPGLIQLEIGVQSTNPETIRAIRRRMDVEQVRRVVARINGGHNVHQHLDLIAGLPFEDYASFRRSFNEVYAMAPEQLQLGFLKVLKGSYMYEMAAEYGLSYRALPPYEVLSTRWLSYGDVLKLKGIEEMVEVHYNSRQFTGTLELLEAEFADAFTMFEDLAAYYEEMGLAGLNHSRLARYEILHAFIGRKRQKHFMEQYEDALLCDLYLRENAKSRPSFALDQTPFKAQVRSLVPELRTLGTQIHVEVLRSGEVLLFDYREREPLTHNARVTKL